MATKRRGSKLNKSENAQVRLDPILKMAAELAAARERRSLSSYIEMAVELAAKQSMVARSEGGDPVSAWDVAQECWNVESLVQLNNLATRYPDLLTIRERKIIDAKRFFCGSEFRQNDNGQIVENLLLEQGWDDLCRYADGHITFAELSARLKGTP